MKYFAPFNSANNSLIFGRGIHVKVSFLVPVAGVTTTSKYFNFL